MTVELIIIILRQTGEEDEWLEANRSYFKALAEAGDEDYIALMEELDSC